MSDIPFITMTPNVGKIASSELCKTTCKDTMNGLPLINRSDMCVCFIPPKEEGDLSKTLSTIILNSIAN